MKYIDEIKEIRIHIEELGNDFRVDGANEYELVTKNGIVLVYGLKKEVMAGLVSKRVKNVDDALLTIDMLYKKGCISEDEAISSTSMIYFNEMVRRCEIKSYIVMDLLNRSGFSIITIPNIISNLHMNKTRQKNAVV